MSGGRLAGIELDWPVAPMLAKPLGARIPDAGPDAPFAYEPKWDGFRVVIFRGADHVVLQGRGLDDLSYAFPEAVAAVADGVPPGWVVDGELIAVRDGRLDFDALSTRLRPRREAGSANIAALARATPTRIVLFDVLAVDGADVRGQPDRVRREALEAVGETGPISRTPRTADPVAAARWLEQLPALGLDGLIRRPLEAAYTPGLRTLGKIKPEHTADVVVAGWRPHKQPDADGAPRVGSLLLGLFDDDGHLRMVGAASAFTAARSAELTATLSGLGGDPTAHPWLGGDAHLGPGQPTRWSAGRDRAWLPVPALPVAEIRFNQAGVGRLRHPAALVRWRPDRTAASCRIDQLAAPAPVAGGPVWLPGLGSGG